MVGLTASRTYSKGWINDHARHTFTMARRLPDSPQVRAFYQLPEDESVRIAPPPFPAERMVPDKPPSRPGAPPLWPCNRTYRWRGDALEEEGACYGRWAAKDMIREFLQLYPQELAGDVAAAQIPLTADFVIRGEPDRAQYQVAIEQLLSLATGIPTALVYRQVSRPVIVLTGKWTPASGLSGIAIRGPSFAQPIGPPESGSMTGFAKFLGDWIGRIVIIEASQSPAQVTWQRHHIRSGTKEQAEQCRDADLVCQCVAEQTGLSRVDKTMEITQLFVEPSLQGH